MSRGHRARHRPNHPLTPAEQQDAYESSTLANVRQLGTNGQAIEMIRARLPFKNKTGTFRGHVVFGVESVIDDATVYHVEIVGRRQRVSFNYNSLPARYRGEFVSDLQAALVGEQNMYLVTSYGVPVAWSRPYPHANAGKLVMPRHFYSNTTSGIQNLIKQLSPEILDYVRSV